MMTPRRPRAITREEWENGEFSNDGSERKFKFNFHNYLSPILLSLISILLWDQMQEIKKGIKEIQATTWKQGEEISVLKANVENIKENAHGKSN